MIKITAKKIYIFLIFVFLYAPIATLMALSFNASRTRAKWGGFTLKWYVSLFDNREIMQALWNTLFIALLSSLTAVIIGTVACIAIQKMGKRKRALMMGITNIPMLNADIVTGISLMLLFISFGIKFGMGTILLAHITFNIPYVILCVMPRMKQINPSTYEAALDLGAPLSMLFLKWFSRIYFPVCFPVSLWPLRCLWMISLLPILQKGPGWIPFPPRFTRKSKKGLNRKCMPFQPSFL